MTELKLKKVSLHIGMHKTGTSSLQHMLHGASKNLRAKRVHYLGMRPFRKGFNQVVRGRSLADENVRQDFSDWLDGHFARGTRRLIVSEENLLGMMRHNLSSPVFYPRMEENLRFLKSTLTYERAEIYLGLRSYESYFNAVYAFRSTQEVVLDFDDYRSIILSQRARVPSMIDRLRKVFPRARISLFFQETMRGCEGQIANEMASGFVKEFAYEEDRNIGFSALAVDALQKIYRLKNRPPNAQERNEIRNEFPRNEYEAPNYWDEQTAHALREEFLNDVEQISKRRNIRFLSDRPIF